MELDEHVCLCFHVSRRKLRNYIRIEKPRRVAQLSECYGAGTGCGWCRPFLKRLFVEMNENDLDPNSSTSEHDLDAISAGDYAARRSKYVQEGGGTPPPGAEPI